MTHTLCGEELKIYIKFSVFLMGVLKYYSKFLSGSLGF